MLAPCVVGFVFITGYFGCNFSTLKVLKLLGISLYCKLIACGVGEFVQTESFSVIHWLSESIHEIVINWFLSAYIVLMMIAPIINVALEKACSQKSLKEALAVFGPFLLAVFVWGFLADYNFTSVIIPRTPGLTAYSGFTLVGIYVAARMMRLLEVESVIKTSLAVGGLVVSLGIASLRFGGYNSLVSLAIATSAFVCFKQMPISDRIGRLFIFLGPSMFSVFMLHANQWIHGSAKGWVESLSGLGLPTFVAMLILAMIYFSFGVLLDLPRRAIGSFIRG